MKKQEIDFWYKTKKVEMFFLIQSFSELLKDESQKSWVEKAKEELEILKANGII